MNQRALFFSQALRRMSSFDQNPENGGTPAMASQPTMNVPLVIGIHLRRAPIFFMSCSSCMPWITEPAPRKRRALKKAWVTMWKMAAMYAPEPTARNMYPSWDTVEYASTFLMSFWAQAMVAAKNAVRAPITAMRVSAPGARSRMGLTRTIRNTPAVTMVAAWMRAETGVGPSMASGSQTYNGSWADLPTAPTKRRRAMAVA